MKRVPHEAEGDSLGSYGTQLSRGLSTWREERLGDCPTACLTLHYEMRGVLTASCLSACPSVHPHGTTQLPLDGF